jgi:hypothetical protein
MIISPSSAFRRDDGDRAVGVVEDGVLNRADAGARTRGMAVPADHHQVGACGVAGEHAGGMPADDVLADPHFRVLAVPLLECRG